MASLSTRYMGIELQNPVIAGASSLTSNMDTIKAIEDSGAAAFVISSLWEEQITMEKYSMEEDLSRFDNLHPEMVSIFPQLEHSGPEEHLMWVRKAKEAVSIPVIASLNAVSQETWVEWAKKLEETGVDGLELNFYAVPKDFDRAPMDIEKEQTQILSEVKKNVKIPIAAKLSSYYTSPLNFIKGLDAVGVDGFVLFNRFFHPGINVDSESNTSPLNLSNPGDNRLSMRFAGLLYDNVKASICASNGVHTAANVVESLLAGATCVQMVSSLFKNSIAVIDKVKKDVTQWMDKKGYASLEEFRGKLSAKNNPDKWTYSRAQYARALLHPQKYVEKYRPI